MIFPHFVDAHFENNKLFSLSIEIQSKSLNVHQQNEEKSFEIKN